MTIFFTESTRSVPSLPSEDNSWAKAVGIEIRTNKMPTNRVLASTYLWRREVQVRGDTAKSRGRGSKEKRSFFIRWFRFYGCVVCVLMEIAYSTTNIKKTTPTPTRDCCRESCSLFVVLRHRTPSSPIGLSEVIQKPFALSRVFLLFSGRKSIILVKKKAPSRSDILLSTHVVLKTKLANPNIHVRRY